MKILFKSIVFSVLLSVAPMLFAQDSQAIIESLNKNREIMPGESLLNSDMGGIINQLMSKSSGNNAPGGILVTLSQNATGPFAERINSAATVRSAIDAANDLIAGAARTSQSAQNQILEGDYSGQRGMYSPRLRIDTKQYPNLKMDNPRFQEQMTKLEQHLKGRVLSEEDRIELEYDGEYLVLKGEVRSEDLRDTVEMIAKMQPGIDYVRNDLRVREQGPRL